MRRWAVPAMMREQPGSHPEKNKVVSIPELTHQDAHEVGQRWDAERSTIQRTAGKGCERSVHGRKRAAALRPGTRCANLVRDTAG